MTEPTFHILVAEPFQDDAVARLRGVGRVTTLNACDEETLRNAVGDADALLVRTYARVTRPVLEAAPKLRVVGRGGVGLENIDLNAARERGITVVYTPGAATDAVADLTVGLMIGLLRRIRWSDAAVRTGRFREAREQCLSDDLGQRTLGIVGLGRIGKAVARRCRHGFGMTILYNDIVEPGLLDFVATSVEKDELYQGSDVVSLHVTLTNRTRRMIDTAALARFKTGAVLINTARGPVVDGHALAEALMAGKLAGAALDVFDPEPLPVDHPLLIAPNTLFTGHIGARTRGGLDRMNAVVDDVIGVLQGRPPRYPAPDPGSCPGACRYPATREE